MSLFVSSWPTATRESCKESGVALRNPSHLPRARATRTGWREPCVRMPVVITVRETKDAAESHHKPGWFRVVALGSRMPKSAKPPPCVLQKARKVRYPRRQWTLLLTGMADARLTRLKDRRFVGLLSPGVTEAGGLSAMNTHARLASFGERVDIRIENCILVLLCRRRCGGRRQGGHVSSAVSLPSVIRQWMASI